MPEENNPHDNSAPVSTSSAASADEGTTAQPQRPMTPVAVAGSQTESKPPQAQSRWRLFLIIIGAIQVACTVVFSLTLPLFWIISPVIYVMAPSALALLALVNFVSLLIYMLRYRPDWKELVLCFISFVVSIVLVAFVAYPEYQSRVDLQKVFSDSSLDVQLPVKTQSEITKDEAATLIKGCRVGTFDYTDQTSKADGDWAELSTTGVVVSKLDSNPYKMSIADRFVSELVPMAKEAQKKCGGRVAFCHDGRCEVQ